MAMPVTSHAVPMTPPNCPPNCPPGSTVAVASAKLAPPGTATANPMPATARKAMP
jgi:hypothetical protein